MLKITRWTGKITEYDPWCCEGPELVTYTTTEGEHHGGWCSQDVELTCETDNGHAWKVCRECARQLGYREANGR